MAVKKSAFGCLNAVGTFLSYSATLTKVDHIAEDWAIFFSEKTDVEMGNSTEEAFEKQIGSLDEPIDILDRRFRRFFESFGIKIPIVPRRHTT